MDKEKVFDLMKEIVDLGREGEYTPEEFRSGVVGVLMLIDNKIKENENK